MPYRRENVGSSSQPQFGVGLVGDGEADGWHVAIADDGNVYEIHVTPGAAHSVGGLIQATNDAIAAMLTLLKSHWCEHGVDLQTAIEVLPRLDPTPEQTQLLKQATVRAPSTLENEIVELTGAAPSLVAIRANAEPAIIGVSLRDDVTVERMQELLRSNEIVRAVFGESLVDELESGDALQTALLERLLMDLSKQIGVAIRTALGERHRILEETRTTPLQEDVRSCQWLQHYLQQHTQKTGFDEHSMWMMMPVGKGSGLRARGSIPRLLKQARAAGKRVDFLVGLNDGMELPEIMEDLSPDDVAVIPLYVNEARSTGQRGRAPLMTTEDVFTNPHLTGTSFVLDAAPDDLHRVFLVHQRKTSASAGKNRMQKLLCRMLFDRVVLGYDKPVPSLMMLVDTDTWLYEDELDDGAADASLGALLREMNNRDLDLIAAQGHSMPFKSDTDRPDADAAVPEIYRLLDHGHGTHINILHGGATFGRFTSLLSLLSVICHRYPGSRNEDLQYTLLANQMGIPHGVSEHCKATNRIHPHNDAQLQRWFSAAAGLRKLYGSAVFRGITDSKTLLSNAASTGFSPETLSYYEALICFGREHPDDLRGAAEWQE